MSTASAATATTLEAVTVDLEIHNAYDDGVVITHVRGAVVAAPPERVEGEEFEEWAWTAFFPHTGTGRAEEATYSVVVTDSSDPRLLGRTVEFS